MLAISDAITGLRRATAAAARRVRRAGRGFAAQPAFEFLGQRSADGKRRSVPSRGAGRSFESGLTG